MIDTHVISKPFVLHYWMLLSSRPTCAGVVLKFSEGELTQMPWFSVIDSLVTELGENCLSEKLANGIEDPYACGCAACL